MWFFNKKYFGGLKSRVALVESFATVIATVYALIPYGFSYNINTLCLVPVFCIMASCNISSYTSIHIGATSFYGSCIASLYCFLIILITRDIIWITFITTFFFSYIVATLIMVPGRKWMGGLFMKKMLVDIIVILYFMPKNTTANTNNWQNLLGACFIFSSIIIAHVCFPTLASRLFFRKTIKTLNSMRIYFRSIGHQLDEKLDLITITNIHKINHSFNEDSTQAPIGVTSPTLKTFENVENQLIKEQQLKMSQSDNLDPINSLPSIMDSNNNNNYNIDRKEINESSSSILNNEEQNLKLKLPLSRSMIIEKSTVLDIKSPPQPPTSANLVPDSIVSPTQTLYDTSSMFAGVSTLSNSATIENENMKKISSTSNIIKLDYNKELKELPVEERKEFNEHEIRTLENKLTNEINRMTAIYNDAKSEKWNSDLLSNYNKLLSIFDMSFKQLISIKEATKSGFSPVASQELILPCIPFVNCLVQEVYLQLGLMLDILSSDLPQDVDGGGGASTTSVSSILYQSFDETQEMIDRVNYAFRQSVDQYEISEYQPISGKEVSKVCFFLYGIMSFTVQQRTLADLLILIKKQQRKESCRWEFIKYGLFNILIGFPVFYINRFKKLINHLSNKEISNSNGKDKPNIFKRSISWFVRNFFRAGKWKYPLQVAFGLISTLIAFYYFDGKGYDRLVIHGIWTCATVVLVFNPSLGSTITRGLQRFAATCLGATCGFLTSLLCSIIPHPWKEIVILIIIFIFVYLISFPQQDIRYSYAGAVSGITFIIIVLGQNRSQDFDYMYAVMRAFHILMGVTWVIIIGLVLFPYFTYKATRIKIFNITNNMSDTFIDIIEKGLRMKEPIQDINGNLTLFNNLGIPEDQQQQQQLFNEKMKIILKLIKNDDSGINSIIQIQNDEQDQDKKETISRERKLKKKKTYESLRSIRVGIDQIKASLYDVRSEMLFVSPSKANKYFKIFDELNDCLTKLFAVENSFDPIFSDIAILSLFTLTNPFHELFQQFHNFKLILNQLISDGGFGAKDGNKNSITESLLSIKLSQTKIDEAFQLARVYLLNEKVFHNLYPEMIRLSSCINATREFIESYVLLLKELRSIRKERSYLKYLLRIKH